VRAEPRSGKRQIKLAINTVPEHNYSSGIEHRGLLTRSPTRPVHRSRTTPWHAMETTRSRLRRDKTQRDSQFRTVILACLVATLSYLAAKVGGALVLRPQMVFPLWPGCAFLVAVLLLTPRKTWPALMAAGLAGFVVYDLQAGLRIRSIALLILGDTVEILIAALGVSYAFGGVPRLNSIKSLATYSFYAVILAPIVVASVGAVALGGHYWVAWRISFLTEALALLTLTPAILSWVDTARIRTPKTRAYYLEAAALIAGLIVLAYIAFVASGGTNRPGLLYSLVPFLLWSALRFESMGVSTSVVVVAFLSVWGAVHARGPFTGPALGNVWSLQLFIFFTAAPFMVLAVLVEERKQMVDALRKLSGRLINAQEEERRRIARDLHDDLNQRLGLLAFGLARLSGRVPAEEANNNIRELWEQATNLSKHVHGLAHELHPSTLEYLGLVVAARALCGEISKQQKVNVEFTEENIPVQLTPEVSLCLFRILQESLNNVCKHSHASVAWVRLTGAPDGIRLTVQDNGIGFDPADKRNRDGLGLLSMNERLCLVEGKIGIDSVPSEGTTVSAWVPINVAGAPEDASAAEQPQSSVKSG
jgi:signal transduction histidine kinase